MTAFSYPRFINFWRKLYQKFENLSLGKQFGVILITIIVIWQAVCFLQGVITARAMNYYCEKEAGIKLAEGTYFMEAYGDEYKKICLRSNLDAYPYHCSGNSNTKNEWIKITGSVERPRGIFSFRTLPQRPVINPSNYIPDDIGGLVKETTTYRDANGKLIYTKIDFIVNAELMLADYYSFKIFKKKLPNTIDKGTSCTIPESDLKYRNSINGFLVNKS